jgi:hypothetical protein
LPDPRSAFLPQYQCQPVRLRHLRECVLFIGTQFSNLYTTVDTPTRVRVGSLAVLLSSVHLSDSLQISNEAFQPLKIFKMDSDAKKRARKQTFLTRYASEQKFSLAHSSVTFNLDRYDLLRTSMAERTFDMNNDIRPIFSPSRDQGGQRWSPPDFDFVTLCRGMRGNGVILFESPGGSCSFSIFFISWKSSI